LTDEEFEKYLRAGEIACRIRKMIPSIVKPGMKVIDLAYEVENAIKALGGEPAFPVNISINEVAAHYTPTLNDETVMSGLSVTKVDIGVHVDGFIADTAITVSFDDRVAFMIQAVEEALEKALRVADIGVKFSQVGAVVEEALRKAGLKPVVNLSGHSMDRYIIHAGETIPNFKDVKLFGKFADGKAYAIEPFATNGKGYVIEGDVITIYALKYNPKKLKNLSEKAREVFNYIYSERRTLPFALRWYTGKFPPEHLNTAIAEIEHRGLLQKYPVLVETSKSVVVQAEHTIVFYKGGKYVTTASC